MRLPFYMRKSKMVMRDGKMFLDLRMNKFEIFCCVVHALWGKITKIFIKE